MHATLSRFLRSSTRPRIFLAGDVMLDHYLWGKVERISPEAPIPILHVDREEFRLGGAGSVATMLAALEADIVLGGVIGDDAAGERVRGMLDALGVDTGSLLVDRSRRTTVKQRLLGGSWQRTPHHMMRVDWEDRHTIADDLCDAISQTLRTKLPQIDLVLISDYAKGVCGDRLLRGAIEIAAQGGVPVIADPIRGADYARYAGCACITPNRVEASQAAGITIRTVEDGLAAGERLVDLGIEAVAVTLDRDGIVWVDRDGNLAHFPCRARQVADVTGAGDMVLSVIGVAFALGADFSVAMELANLAGGLEVEHLGVVPLTRADLLRELSEQQAIRAAGTKIVTIESLLPELRRLRAAGKQIVMTNGCFDLLHPGHVASLQEAKRLGDCLVVGVNSDRSVKELKGPERPVIDQQGRAEMLAALECVDYVVVFDEASVAPLVEKIKPDVLVKASQYPKEQIVGWQIVEENGGRVVPVPMKGDYSTTRLIEKARGVDSRQRRAS
ncbi:MAG: D-glycero-beta-D-manno-heptose 1-phosphate adenylyltransferase [Planctomycetota bacterium]|nr:MAG: D-glycero-beta-D-manno-heptose 1-phosphate adenylyltransferase [Planctomycetota bacterium]